MKERGKRARACLAGEVLQIREFEDAWLACWRRVTRARNKKQTNKQTHTQTNKHTNTQTKTIFQTGAGAFFAPGNVSTLFTIILASLPEPNVSHDSRTQKSTLGSEPNPRFAARLPRRMLR